MHTQAILQAHQAQHAHHAQQAQQQLQQQAGAQAGGVLLQQGGSVWGLEGSLVNPLAGTPGGVIGRGSSSDDLRLKLMSQMDTLGQVPRP